MMHFAAGVSRRISVSRCSSAIRSPVSTITMSEGPIPQRGSRSGARKKAPTAVLPAP